MRLIDADVLKKEIDEWLDSVGEATIAKNRAYYGELMGCIKDTPTVERPRGEWQAVDECSNTGVYCSECYKKVYNIGYSYNRIKMPYCPNCGSYNGHSVRGEGE